MRLFHSPFHKIFGKFQTLLLDKLIISGVNEEAAKSVIDSGFYMKSPDSAVYDSFYAPQWAFCGQFSLDDIIARLNGVPYPFTNKVPESTIKDISELYTILNADLRSQHYLNEGSLTFRGQTNEYKTIRSFPNPAMADELGLERLVIPGLYRKYKDNFQDRIFDEQPQAVFNTLLGDDLVYYGIENWNTLSQRNFEKYGVHNISDLVDFTEPENQEYYKRWRNIKVQGAYFPDIAIVSQHYGYQTYGLDVTFNPSIAAFFAANRFVRLENGKADYQLIKKAKHKGVIYCFYFSAPQLRRTKDIIQDVFAFESLYPLRPIRQECALPFFLADQFNEAAQFLHHIFYLHPDFDISELPDKKYLFPSTAEDPFYHAALDVKRTNELWKEFVEYDF